MQELDLVVLTRDVEEFGLKSGDVGTVVHCYGQGEAFEVEFVAASGGDGSGLDPNACGHPSPQRAGNPACAGINLGKLKLFGGDGQ
jgi:hypothetical protein